MNRPVATIRCGHCGSKLCDVFVLSDGRSSFVVAPRSVDVRDPSWTTPKPSKVAPIITDRPEHPPVGNDPEIGLALTCNRCRPPRMVHAGGHDVVDAVADAASRLAANLQPRTAKLVR